MRQTERPGATGSRLPLAAPTVQRVEAGPEATGTITSASERSPDESKPAEFTLDSIDMEELTDRLWSKIRYKLRIERERSRGWT